MDVLERQAVEMGNVIIVGTFFFFFSQKVGTISLITYICFNIFADLVRHLCERIKPVNLIDQILDNIIHAQATGQC